MLAGATRAKKGSGDGGALRRLLDVNTGRQSGFKYELVCHFELAVDITEGDVRKFVNDTDGPAFLKVS